MPDLETKPQSGVTRLSAASATAQSNLSAKLSSSQLLDQDGYGPLPSPEASQLPPGSMASPSQPPSVSDIRSGLPTHLWAALEQRWSEGQEAVGHQGVLLSVDDEMVRSTAGDF
jgi:hypothetical protein